VKSKSKKNVEEDNQGVTGTTVEALVKKKVPKTNVQEDKQGVTGTTVEALVKKKAPKKNVQEDKQDGTGVTTEALVKEKVPKKNAEDGTQSNITVKALDKKKVRDVIDILEESVKEYMLHLRRINHQYRTLKQLKESVGVNDLVLHVDFSEN